MTPDLLYTILNTGILPAWILLVFFPHWKGTQKIIHAIWIPCLLGIFYAWLLFTDDNPETVNADFSTLQGMMSLLSSPQAFLAGWVHYLIFDLFVGAWIVRDAKRQGIKHLMIVPCILFTLMLGPLGLTLYLFLKAGLKRNMSLVEG